MRGLWGLLVFFGFSSAHAVGLNDVSILIPLPIAAEIPQMIGPQATGAKGALLAKKIYDQLPNLVVGHDPEEMFAQELKVVGVRLDPCFAEGEGPRACRRQIRLVWQPIVEARGNSLTMDAAAHTFYDFDEKEWSALLKEWKRISLTDPDLPLQVHPILQSEGPGGEFAKNLRSILTRYCGEKNISRVTVMTVNPIGTVWAFVGFDLRNGDLKPIRIPRINRAGQAFFVDLADLSEFRADISPVVPDVSWMRVVSDSRAARERMSEDEIKSVIGKALSFENPRLQNPGTVDCVSCHISQTLRVWAERNFSGWSWTSDFETVRYRSPRPLLNHSVQAGFANRLRAFGYFADEPVFSQRVINESAEVVDSLGNPDL